MHKLLKPFFLLCFFFFQSCEDDEICIEPITAKMNTSITAQSTSSIFSINNLTVTDINSGESNVVFSGVGISSFKVLLSTLKESAKYKIDITFTSSNPSQIKPPISETLTVNYIPVNQYVSKACGFKTSYKNLSYSTTGALTVIAIKTEINNENETHLILQY